MKFVRGMLKDFPSSALHPGAWDTPIAIDILQLLQSLAPLGLNDGIKHARTRIAAPPSEPVSMISRPR
jgi:hypothetical protein